MKCYIKNWVLTVSLLAAFTSGAVYAQTQAPAIAEAPSNAVVSPSVAPVVDVQAQGCWYGNHRGGQRYGHQARDGNGPHGGGARCDWHDGDRHGPRQGPRHGAGYRTGGCAYEEGPRGPGRGYMHSASMLMSQDEWIAHRDQLLAANNYEECRSLQTTFRNTMLERAQAQRIELPQESRGNMCETLNARGYFQNRVQ